MPGRAGESRLVILKPELCVSWIKMKWIEAKVVFDHPDKDLAVDLISDVFYDFGLQGVVVEDPRIEPAEGWPEDVIGRPVHYTVSGYFHKDGRVDNRCRILEEKLAHFKEQLGLVYRMSYRELDEEDWAHSWKAYFWPQKIGRNMVVRPTWRDYRADSSEIVIDLDPGMAFGTGTHPTTAMCVAMIETYLKKGNCFLDVGTGSGILLIAAAKLGADKVCGVDNDQTAVEIAAGNLNLNGIKAQNTRLICGNLVEVIREQYDIVAANILSHVILDLLGDIRRVLKSGGVFICSGIVDKNEDQVVASMKNTGFKILEISSKEEWVAIAGRLKA
jgi:ribosomal protein L11 methyltransferase